MQIVSRPKSYNNLGKKEMGVEFNRRHLRSREFWKDQFGVCQQTK